MEFFFITSGPGLSFHNSDAISTEIWFTGPFTLNKQRDQGGVRLGRYIYFSSGQVRKAFRLKGSSVEVSKGAKIRNQYNQVPHQWESDKLTVRHHK